MFSRFTQIAKTVPGGLSGGEIVYEGLCVTGMHDGEWISHDSPSFWVPRGGGVIKSSTPMEGRDLENDDTPFAVGDIQGTFAETTYIHCGLEGIGQFWVPKGRDAHWALQRIIEKYVRAG